MIADVTLPAGFTSTCEGARQLVADDACAEALALAGLERPENWDELIAGGRLAAGRGRVGRWSLPGGDTLILKQLRRGGVLAPLWGERHTGVRRALSNLITPLRALEKGIATPRPQALLLVEGPPLLYRVWMATTEVPGRDLLEWFASPSERRGEILAAAMRFVREMHDLGLEHRDLNLGNLIVDDSGGEPRPCVLDLDRARVHPGPLDFARRQRALRRLERSYVKTVGRRERGSDATPDLLYAMYAGKDADLASRLDRGRRVGRWHLRWHRLGWK